jgi:hypothetical protein
MANTLTYEKWLAEVKHQWNRTVPHVPFDDLPDWSHHYRQWHDSNMRPSAALARLLDAFSYGM